MFMHFGMLASCGTYLTSYCDTDELPVTVSRLFSQSVGYMCFIYAVERFYPDHQMHSRK